MINDSASFDVTVSDEDIQTFAELTGDFNPLHIDSEYAKNTNFEGQVVHGALLIGYISRLLGMHIPGKKCIINNFTVKLSNPVYVNTKIRIKGSIQQYNDSLESGRVVGEINDVISNKIYSTFQVDFSKHHKLKEIKGLIKKEKSNDKKIDVKENSLLIIGASGGIGNTLSSSLSKDYLIRTAGRDLSKNDLKLNLSDPNSISDMFERGEVFQSIICLASDPLISSPLQANSDLINSVEMNSVGVVSLVDNAFKKGAKKIIFFSSTMGDSNNLDGEFASYALGKNILNATLSLLSKKYAGRMEIYNIVLGNMFTGLTAGSPELKIKRYTLSTTTKKGANIIELAQLVDEILSGNLGSLSGNKIRFTSGL